MPGLWVPPTVSRDLRDNTARFNVQVALAVEESGPAQRYWNLRLRHLDPLLTLVKAKDDAMLPGLRPGFWHVRRDNAPAPVSLIALEHADGSFREPGSWMEEMLRAGDLQSDRSVRLREQAEKAREVAKERQRALEHEQRVDHMRDNLNAISRPSVSMSDTDWSARAGRRKRAA